MNGKFWSASLSCSRYHRRRRRRRSMQWRRWELYCLRHGGVPNLGWRNPQPLAKVLPFDPDFRLPNLTDIPIEQLQEMLKTINPNSPLGHSLQRIIDENDKPTDAVAGWNAAIG